MMEEPLAEHRIVSPRALCAVAPCDLPCLGPVGHSPSSQLGMWLEQRLDLFMQVVMDGVDAKVGQLAGQRYRPAPEAEPTQPNTPTAHPHSPRNHLLDQRTLLVDRQRTSPGSPGPPRCGSVDSGFDSLGGLMVALQDQVDQNRCQIDGLRHDLESLQLFIKTQVLDSKAARARGLVARETQLSEAQLMQVNDVVYKVAETMQAPLEQELGLLRAELAAAAAASDTAQPALRVMASSTELAAAVATVLRAVQAGYEVYEEEAVLPGAADDPGLVALQRRLAEVEMQLQALLQAPPPKAGSAAECMGAAAMRARVAAVAEDLSLLCTLAARLEQVEEECDCAKEAFDSARATKDTLTRAWSSRLAELGLSPSAEAFAGPAAAATAAHILPRAAAGAAAAAAAAALRSPPQPSSPRPQRSYSSPARSPAKQSHFSEIAIATSQLEERTSVSSPKRSNFAQSTAVAVGVVTALAAEAAAAAVIASLARQPELSWPPCKLPEPQLIGSADPEGLDASAVDFRGLSMPAGQGGQALRFHSAPWQSASSAGGLGGSAGGLADGRDRSPCRAVMQTIQDNVVVHAGSGGPFINSRVGAAQAAQQGKVQLAAAPARSVHVWRPSAGSMKVVGPGVAQAPHQTSGAPPRTIVVAALAGVATPAISPPMHIAAAPRSLAATAATAAAIPASALRRSAAGTPVAVSAPQILRIAGQGAASVAQPRQRRLAPGSVVLATQSAPPSGCCGQAETPALFQKALDQPDSARGRGASEGLYVHL